MKFAGSPETHPRSLASGLVLLAGAGIYALVESRAVADFSVTPLMLGAVAVAAGLIGTRRRIVATGLVLMGWGVAVILVARGVIPADRTPPAYMIGVAAGLLAAAAVAGSPRRAQWLTSGVIAAFVSGLGYYFAYDFGVLAQWKGWTFAMLAWAGWELFWGVRVGSRPAPIGTAAL